MGGSTQRVARTGSGVSGLGPGVGCLVLWRERRGEHREGQEDREDVAEVVALRELPEG